MQNPGVHSIKIGDITVTALNDGQFQANSAIVNGITAEQADAAEAAAFRFVPPKITINAFVLTIGGKHILVDTGCGTAFGPAMGKSRDKLATLGITHASVETILVTHAHVDHVCGLIDPEGKGVFPNAELVMHEAEPAFWLNEANAAAAPDAAKDAFKAAQAALGPYAGRIRTLAGGQEGVPGVALQPLPGHTPGHSGWLVTSGSESLLIWGDVVHLPGVQFAHPQAGLAFDTDSDLARTSRLQALEMAAAEKLLVAGMHLDFPTFGYVAKAAEGFAFVPKVWAPEA